MVGVEARVTFGLDGKGVSDTHLEGVLTFIAWACESKQLHGVMDPKENRNLEVVRLPR